MTLEKICRSVLYSEVYLREVIDTLRSSGKTKLVERINIHPNKDKLYGIIDSVLVDCLTDYCICNGIIARQEKNFEEFGVSLFQCLQQHIEY